MALHIPFSSVRAPGGMVCSADQLATQAGTHVLASGGNAVDAAIATNAVMAVVAPHLCGMGGDLFALVHRDGESEPIVLNASGRAGSGVDADAMRAEGLTTMPFRHDMRTVTVPGCVDGWMALHERFGTRPLAELLEPAETLAADGFPASPLLLAALAQVDDAGLAQLADLTAQARHPGSRVVRPGAARALAAIAADGRAGFYGGEFGEGFLRVSNGVHSAADLDRRQADWVAPLGVTAFGHHVWTVPPNSQGYLILAAARIAEQLDLPADADDPRWAHLLIEAAAAVGRDRPASLHEGADGEALVAEDLLARLAAAIDPVRAHGRAGPGTDGDTTYLCVVDRERMGVSLIQSNASGFGSWLVEPNTGINLHNRGLGFDLTVGHPAAPGPGRRPPHTLCPALVTRPDGSLHAVLGTMGGDAQPQIVLQVLVRLLAHGQSPAVAVGSGRWALTGARSGFDTWTSPEGPSVLVEGHGPVGWETELGNRGHRARRTPPWDNGFGHAHAIVVEPTGLLAGAADPRSRVGSAAGVW